MKHLENIDDFKEIISGDKVVVDFYAQWCGPCKMLAPILEEVANKHDDITFLKVDTDQFEAIAREYGIMSIPTLKIFKKGEEVSSHTGFMSMQEVEDFIK